MAMSPIASMYGQRLVRDLQIATERIRMRGEQQLETKLVRTQSSQTIFSIAKHGILKNTTLACIKISVTDGARIFGNRVLDLGRPTCTVTATYSPLLAEIVREEIGAFVDAHGCDSVRFVCDPGLR